MRVLDLENLLPEESKRFDQLAHEVKKEYNELVGGLAKQLKYDFDWLLSPLLSRNPYLVPTFEQLCFLRLIAELLREKETINKVATSDRTLALVLQGNGVSVELRQSSKATFGLKAGLKRILILLYTAFVYIKSRSKKRSNAILKGKELILIELFLLPSMFKNGRFEDRYFPGILDHLEDDQRSQIYFIPQLINVKKGIKPLLNRASDASYQFIYKFDFLRLSDYVYALMASWRMRGKVKGLQSGTFHGFDIQPLIEEAIKKSYYDNSQFIGLLNYRFIKRLKNKGIRVKLFVDWFENQPIDKGLHRAIHKYYPQAETKGYLGFIVSWLFNLYMQPLKFEKENRLLPQKVSVVGESVVDLYKEESEIQVESAPAFRFNTAAKRTKESTRSKVLFALPIHIEDSIGLIHLADSLSKLPEFREQQFTIKGHPAYDIDQLIKSAGVDSNAKLDVSKGDFSEVLARAKVMISTASTTCLEAVLSGVPVLIMANNRGLTQNPIPDSVDRTSWSIVYDDNEAREQLIRCLNYSEATMSQLSEAGQSIRASFFKGVNKETVSEFLQLA